MNQLLKNVLSLPALKRCLPFILGKRGAPLYLAVLVHTEKIQDRDIFEKMLSLGKALPFKPAACVMTPENPFVRADMKARGVGGEEFLGRLKDLAPLFEIGYHGHYCRPSAEQAAPGARTEIERAGFALTLNEPEALKAQFLAEYGYLASNLYPPKAYSAGWWFMNSVVAGLLETNKFETDSSLRRAYRDTFGNEYLPEDRMPENGVPFVLPGTGKVIEFPSVFYLHMNWWTVVKELFPLLRRNRGPLFAVLPTHDYNLAEDLPAVLGNIKLLSSIPGVRFVGLKEMKELSDAAGPVFGAAGFTPSECPACGTSAAAALWREDIYRAAECRACGLIRVDPQPPGQDEIYSDKYYQDNYLRTAPDRLLFFRKRLSEIEKIKPGKGRVLDIGCGVGFFLKEAKAGGWAAAGVEPSKFAAGYARKEFGLEVSASVPLDARRAFDLVTLWDVIAHLEDPAASLKELNRLLKEGGLLALTTPVRPRPVFKFAALLSRFITSRYYLHIPQQLFHFTPATLDRTLARAGFRVLSSEYAALPSRGGFLSVYKGGAREIASKFLHLLADRFHHREYLLTYAVKEREV